MAKDPAFLFYPGDWLQGTLGMTFEEKGAYMELLILQFNCGKFTRKQAENVLSICSAYVFENVLKKFETDGVYYWKTRLALEMKKRENYTESRRKNAKSKKSAKSSEPYAQAYAGTYANHMHKHMENENVNENENENNNENEPDFFKPDIEGDSLVFPLDTQAVRELWASWKRYRWHKHNQRYAMMGEQADLKRLEGMSFSQIKQTILAAIAGNWKNLYPENVNANGKPKTTTKEQQSAATADYLRKHYSQKLGKKGF
jgi:hypothetical protein